MATFDTSILDAALAEEQTQREQDRQELLQRTLQVLNEVGAQFGITRAYLFGSLLQPTRFRADSDIDIAVEEIAPEHHFRAISVLMTALGREVDLVDLVHCPFAHRIREIWPVMDKQIVIVLKADLATQMALVELLYERLEEHARDLNPNDMKQIESVAYQLHNVYAAIETLLEIVATHFENHIADASRWHSALLLRMAQPVEGVRPALLATQTLQLLDALRGFRHFFRHAYAAMLDPVQLTSNLEKARQLRSKLQADVKRFLDQLAP